MTARLRRPGGGSNLDAYNDRDAIADAHAVEFSKTAELSGGRSLAGRPSRPRARGRAAGQPASIALTRPQAPKSALADFQHLPLRPLAGNVVLADGELGGAERHSPLIDEPARLRAGDAELVGHHGRQVDDAAVGAKGGLPDVLGGPAFAGQAIEAALCVRRILGRVKPRHDPARERPLGVTRREPGGVAGVRLPSVEQEPVVVADRLV